MAQNPNNTAYAVLQEINEKYIKLKGEAISECNQIIKFVKNVMIEQMCQVDPLFNAIFQRVYHTGSFYDGLKVGEPEEYDLNLVLEPKLPKHNCIFWRKFILKNKMWAARKFDVVSLILTC